MKAALEGETIAISDGDRLLVRPVPIATPDGDATIGRKRRRALGGLGGRVGMRADFDAPLSDGLQAYLDGRGED